MKPRNAGGAVAALALSLVGSPCTATPLWTVHTGLTPYTLRAVAYGTPGGNPLYVAVGDGAQVFTSPDGGTWTSANSTLDSNASLYSVAYGVVGGQGYFVAVGNLNSTIAAVVVYSTDGLNWHAGTTQSGTPPLTGVAYGVAAGTAQFVAAGYSGTIVTSTDGQTWGPAASGLNSSEYLQCVAYGVINGVGGFVAAGNYGDQSYSWTGSGPWTPGGVGLDGGASGIAYGNSQFVALGYSPSGFYASSDGSSWTQTGGGGAGFHFVAGQPITYGNISGQGFFVAVAYMPAGAPSSAVFFSRSGNCNWNEIETDVNEPLYGVTYGNGLFVAVGANGTVMSSTLAAVALAPPMGWVLAPYAPGTANTSDNLTGVARGYNQFVAVGAAADSSFTSPNGFPWSQGGGGLSYGSLAGVEYYNGFYVAVDSSGGTYTSSSGTTWTQTRPQNGTGLYGLAAGAGIIVAVGQSGTALETVAAPTLPWTSLNSGVSLNLNAVCFGEASGVEFVAVGDGGTIVTLDNGWTQRSSGTAKDLESVAFGNGRYVAVGRGGTILSSTDGVTWSPPAVYYNAGQDLYAVCYGNSRLGPQQA